jgi:NAD dependent epimerase/dehydratase family enzyme
VAFGREFADELLFGSLRVLPARLTASGFRFHHLELAGALADVAAR